MVALQAADLVVLDGDGVVVQTDVAGCVDLTAGDARFIDTVEKQALDKAAADRMIDTTDQHGDVIRVTVQEAKGGGLRVNFGSHNARITVTLPAKAQITALTGDGRVEVRDVRFSGDSDRSNRGTARGRLGSPTLT